MANDGHTRQHWPYAHGEVFASLVVIPGRRVSATWPERRSNIAKGHPIILPPSQFASNIGGWPMVSSFASRGAAPRARLAWSTARVRDWQRPTVALAIRAPATPAPSRPSRRCGDDVAQKPGTIPQHRATSFSRSAQRDSMCRRQGVRIPYHHRPLCADRDSERRVCSIDWRRRRPALRHHYHRHRRRRP